MSITAEVSVATGLSSAQVEQRRREGLGNEVPDRSSRGVGEIIRANVLTRINAMLGVLLVLVLATGSWIDGTFGLLIIANSAVGIVQEVRAKRTLDRLAIVGQAKPIVRRDGEARALAPSEVVRDDVIELGPGDQIVVDGRVVAAELLEVDESLLTGEPDPIAKEPGDHVLSGSYVVSGSGACLATRVGSQAYAARLAAEASRFTLVDSQVRSGIDTILKVITYLLIPAGLLSIGNQLVASRQGWRPAVTGMVAALVPMVPEGLVLLTSIAFAVGVVRLGARRCLVQELPAIEGLARVDVVCADKTGTLTQHGMRLSELRVLDPEPGAETTIRRVLAAMAADDRRPNASVQALAEDLGPGPGWQYTAVAPFSSAKKWSGFSYGEHGNWVLGAPDVLAAPETPAARTATELAGQGLRVLLLGRSDRSVADPGAPGTVRPAALVVLAQKIRSDARETLNYFASQGVSLKVLSGDNAVSVGAVASSLGVPGGEHPVDARDLPEDREELAEVLEGRTTFGRVRPDQKRAMVGALQASGHTVAMTGDGVNDVLALKDADIGVAMGSGSSAARAVAQLVLLDNEFATLPYVVAEGRRVIGNIERVSNLFLTKTVYSVVLAFLVGLVGIVGRLAGHEPIGYPFLPRHVTIVAWFTIGIPAFVLSLAPNHERARDGFVSRVLRLAIPSGVVIGVCTFAAYLLAYAGPHATDVQQRQSGTTALITVITIAMWVLAIVARPYTWWKIVLLGGSVGAYVVLFMVPVAQRFFALDPSNLPLTGVGLACGVIGIALVEVAWWVPRVSRRARFPGPASNRRDTRW